MWNLSLQRTLPWGMVGEVAYVGTRHRHVWINLPRNTVPSEFLSRGTALNAPVPNPFFGVIRTGDAALTGPTTSAGQLLRPYPQYVGVARFSGIRRFATGRPLVVAFPVSNGSTGIGAFARVVGPLRLPAGQQSFNRWFNNEKDPTKSPALLPPLAFTLGDGKRTYPA